MPNYPQLPNGNAAPDRALVSWRTLKQLLKYIRAITPLEGRNVQLTDAAQGVHIHAPSPADTPEAPPAPPFQVTWDTAAGGGAFVAYGQLDTYPFEVYVDTSGTVANIDMELGTPGGIHPAPGFHVPTIGGVGIPVAGSRKITCADGDTLYVRLQTLSTGEVDGSGAVTIVALSTPPTTVRHRFSPTSSGDYYWPLADIGAAGLVTQRRPWGNITWTGITFRMSG